MTGFADLGIAAPLIDAAAGIGWDEPLPIQRAAVPVLRRGSNAVLRAASGSGVTGAYGLALLDRLASGESSGAPRALVLVASDSRAADVAVVLGRLAAGGSRVAALERGWRSAGDADVIVATPGALREALGGSAVKLDAVETMVLEGADVLIGGVDGELLETVLVSVPSGTQRVVTAPTLTRDIERFVEAHVRRAMTIPPLPADAAVPPRVAARPIAYVVVPVSEKESTLARLLEATGVTKVAVRGPRDANALRDVLRMRGYGDVGVAAFTDGSATGASIAYHVPPDHEALAALDEELAIVVAEPGELRHLRATAVEANIELRARALPRDSGTVLETYRTEIRRALREDDIAAQMLVLGPLFEEASPVEVAAALSALLRRRPATRETREPASPVQQQDAPPKPRPYVRLFVGVGQKDGVRPADIVGSFTGEAGITGEQIGRIEIRDTFSVVEVDPDIAERVIRALNGTTMRGRSVRVDYDRKSPGPPQRRRTRP